MMTTANMLDNTLRPIQEYTHNGHSQQAFPLAMGAGHINPNKALDPGLVYDATPQDYVNLACSVRPSKGEIKKITKSSKYSCSNPSSNLNYLSLFITYKYRRFMKRKPVNFQRTVTNVGEGAATYNARVNAIENFDVMVMPKTLVFERKYEKKTYNVTLSPKRRLEYFSSFSELMWVEENEKHHVGSLIVVEMYKNLF